jgi:hypothetical protein
MNVFLWLACFKNWGHSGIVSLMAVNKGVWHQQGARTDSQSDHVHCTYIQSMHCDEWTFSHVHYTLIIFVVCCWKNECQCHCQYVCTHTNQQSVGVPQCVCCVTATTKPLQLLVAAVADHRWIIPERLDPGCVSRHPKHLYEEKQHPLCCWWKQSHASEPLLMQTTSSLLADWLV